MTLHFIKESDSLAKTTQYIAILLHTHTSNNHLVPRRHLYHISSSKNTRKNDKISQKYFIESISFEDVSPDQLRHSNKLTRFQIYPETEFVSKYNKPLYKTQYSEILVEYEDDFAMKTGKLIIHEMATSRLTTDENLYVPVKFQKNTGRIGGKLKQQDKDITRLQELSLMNNTHFGAIHYDKNLDIKLDYTKSRIFQKLSLTNFETLHQLCELERTQIFQSLALAVLKIPYAGYLLSGNRSNFIDYEGNILWYYT